MAPRHVAHYKAERDGKTEYHSKTVVSWSTSGTPLVLHQNELINARDILGFETIEEDNEPIGVLPDGGWRVRWTDDDGAHSEPIIGWVVNSDGYAEAITHEEGGVGTTATPVNAEIYHPDAQ